MIANPLWFGVNQRHHVLQLIAEPEGAPRLIVAATRPDAARQRLIDQPAVDQQIHSGIRRLDLHGAERMAASAAPPRPAPRAPPADRESVRSSVPPRRHRARHQGGKRSRARRRLRCRTATWMAAHGSSPAPTLPDRRARFNAAGSCGEPLRPMNSLRSPVSVRPGSSTSKKATRPANSVP